MTTLWFRQRSPRRGKREVSYHALLRMRDTKYLCGKISDKLTIVEQDRFMISGQLCAVCFELAEGKKCLTK